MIEITEEMAEALVHQGPCWSAQQFGVQTTRVVAEGLCPFCDLARMLKSNQPVLQPYTG